MLAGTQLTDGLDLLRKNLAPVPAFHPDRIELGIDKSKAKPHDKPIRTGKRIQ